MPARRHLALIAVIALLGCWLPPGSFPAASGWQTATPSPDVVAAPPPTLWRLPLPGITSSAASGSSSRCPASTSRSFGGSAGC